MATSLSEQLARLKAPQSFVSTAVNYHVSIIFDRQEASTKSRRTIFDLGLSGLEELIILNPTFKQFQWTLFEENTFHLERAVEVQKVNDLLNANIRKFLRHLSPYLLLRPAQLCLEWLIRRFQVHTYNARDLLALILPYHETNIFVRILQIIKIVESDQDWNWLIPLQKPGIKLSKSSLLTRAATNQSFFNFVCKTTLAAIEELDIKASILQNQLNFYTAVVVGALEYADVVQEWHITHLLPSLLKGLSSNINDFVSAAYIITAQLFQRTKLKTKLTCALIKRISKPVTPSLYRSSVLLMVLMFNSQPSPEAALTEDLLLQLITTKWFLENLSDLAKENYQIQAICIFLVQHCITAVFNNHNNSNDFTLFLEKLLDSIYFPDKSAQKIIRTFFENYSSKSIEGKQPSEGTEMKESVINLVSDDENENITKKNKFSIEFIEWYEKYMAKLERQYPVAFENIIKESIKNYQQYSSNYMAAIKLAIGYRLNLSNINHGCNLYANLYHPMSIRRLTAIRELLNGLHNYKKSAANREILKDCFWDRLNDECLEVVVEILKLSTENIIEIISCERFVSSLMMVLYKLQVHQFNNNDIAEDKNSVISLALLIAKHLTNDNLLHNYDNNVILLTLVPLLFPRENEWFSNDAIETVLNSNLSKCFKFLNRWKADSKNSKIRNFSECKTTFTKVLSTEKESISITEFIESVMRIHNTEGIKEYKKFHDILILLTGFLKEPLTIDESWQIFKNIQILQQGYNIRNIKAQFWKLSTYENCIPLKLYSNFLIELVKKTNFQNMTCSCNEWEKSENKELQFFLSIFEAITNEVFNKDLTNSDQMKWFAFLKEVCDVVFQYNDNIKHNFLMNFYIYDKPPIPVENYFELRLKAFHLMRGFIRNSSSYKWNIMHILQMYTALINKSQIIRQETIKTLENIFQDKFNKDVINVDNYDCDMQNLLANIIDRKEEIVMDNEQFALMFYIVLNKNKSLCTNVVTKFIKFFGEQNESCPHLILKLLYIFTHFNNTKILLNQISMATNILKKCFVVEKTMKYLREPYDKLFYTTINGINSKEIDKILHEDIFSNFIEEIYKSNKIFIIKDNSIKSVPCTFLEMITENTFCRFPTHLQNSVILRTIDSLAESDSNNLFKAIRKLSKTIDIDCGIFVPLIKSMSGNKKSEIVGIQKIPVNTMQWRRGNIVMELLEGNKRLLYADKLIPSLFEVFNLCLFADEQITVEFSRQLILSMILDCCKLAKKDQKCDFEKLSQNVIRIDQIVECLRVSVNSQTHQNALLLLTYCATFIPQQVLNNIVNIFTFMGSSVVRLDDAFSFLIIKDIIDTIIPILIKDKTFLVPVLKVFSDILLDVPEHRRSGLYTCLINTLDAKQYFWMFLCVVFEGQIVGEEKKKTVIKSDEMLDIVEIKSTKYIDYKPPQRIEILLDLINSFDAFVILETCLKMVKYVKDLTISTSTSKAKKKENIENSNKQWNLYKELFDIDAYSDKLLHKYIYIIMQFLAAATGSNQFLEKVAECEETCENLHELKDIYEQLIVHILSYISIINQNSMEESSIMNTNMEDDDLLSQSNKSGKLFILHIYELLDNVVSLLSPNAYLTVVSDLMHHQLPTVRKRTLELFRNKLEKDKEYLNGCSAESFMMLLDAINRIVINIRIDRDVDTETIYIQQSALHCVILLSKQHTLNYKKSFDKMLISFREILDTTKKFSNKNSSKILYATILLANIEIMCSLRAHGLRHLPYIMDYIHVALEKQAKLLTKCSKFSEDNICLPLITGVQKLFETIPAFLSSYLIETVISLGAIKTCLRNIRINKDTGCQKSLGILQKITTVWTKIAVGIELRMLSNNFENIYSNLMAQERYNEVEALMELVQETIRNHTSQEITEVHDTLSRFYLHSLEYRDKLTQSIGKNSSLTIKQINQVEESIIEAFVLWILKLSESSFRPLYNRICFWALQQTNSKESIATFFLLSKRIAMSFKTLFVLFAGDFIDDAARILKDCNLSQNHGESESCEKNVNEELNQLIIKSILDTLYTVLLYDNKTFINNQRFRTLTPAIVDQLENPVVLEEKSLQDSLRLCIVQLAIDVSDDVMCKQLNNLILLKTRCNQPETRIFAFECCVAITKQLSSEFNALLPDTVVFIAELLEDGNPRVEKRVKKLIQEMESYIGESIQNLL